MVMSDKMKQIYIKNIKFNPVIHILKTYLEFVLPISIFITIMCCAYPFIDSGPIFPYYTLNTFVENCSEYWWTSILFIQDIYPWSPTKTCGPHLFYISVEFQFVALILPIYLYMYKYASRRLLFISLLVGLLGGGVIPTVVLT
jgi:peptidoglycan/LPS O-acetylase OafA/YrhL